MKMPEREGQLKRDTRGCPDPPSRQMRLWLAAALAFVAMCAQDIIGTAMVIFEAHYTPWLAGASDVVGYFFSLVCTIFAIGTVIKTGRLTKRSVVLIGAVSLANFMGTCTGVEIAKRLASH